MDINSLKQSLINGDYTCILSDGNEVIKSKDSGIKPLVTFIVSGKNFKGFCAADRIVGKAAAFLYACMGISKLHAFVASTGAVEVCEKYGIELTYDTLCERIINRKGDDICPMEKLVEKIDDPEIAKEALLNKVCSQPNS